MLGDGFRLGVPRAKRDHYETPKLYTPRRPNFKPRAGNAATPATLRNGRRQTVRCIREIIGAAEPREDCGGSADVPIGRPCEFLLLPSNTGDLANQSNGMVGSPPQDRRCRLPTVRGRASLDHPLDVDHEMPKERKHERQARMDEATFSSSSPIFAFSSFRVFVIVFPLSCGGLHRRSCE